MDEEFQCLVYICYLITKINMRGDEGVVAEGVCGAGLGCNVEGRCMVRREPKPITR